MAMNNENQVFYQLSADAPFIWPDARFHTGQAKYEGLPPTSKIYAEAELISGVIVGAAEGTVKWLQNLLSVNNGERRICIVLVLYPASPTRKAHLKAMLECQAAASPEKLIDVRILLMDRYFGSDCARFPLPPTIIQAKCGSKTTMSIGSVGDLGHDKIFPGSFNLVFQPDDALRDVWRKWFQYVLEISVPLSNETIGIPTLFPPEGQLEATLLWREFESTCTKSKKNTLTEQTQVKVNIKTGEVVSDLEGKIVIPWDNGNTALDPLGQVLNNVYANGWLVTVNESTRIKPLSIPVKSTLLGQPSERVIGAVKHTQAFSLQILDDDISKAIEKCRKITDLIDMLTFPLSQGNRWLPKSAYFLLEKGIKARNEDGKKLLCQAMEQKNVLQQDLTYCVQKFIEVHQNKIREDLNKMNKELGQGDTVSDSCLQKVFNEIETRLTQALTVGITPSINRNSICAPDLTVTAPDENWDQPFSLLLRTAKCFRVLLTDPYFRRQLSCLKIDEEDYIKACNVFNDTIISSRDWRRAEADLTTLKEIDASEKPAKDKCKMVWSIIQYNGQSKGD